MKKYTYFFLKAFMFLSFYVSFSMEDFCLIFTEEPDEILNSSQTLNPDQTASSEDLQKWIENIKIYRKVSKNFKQKNIRVYHSSSEDIQVEQAKQFAE